MPEMQSLQYVQFSLHHPIPTTYLRKLVELAEDAKSCFKQVGVLWFRNIGDTGDQVETDPAVRRVVDVLLQIIQLLHLHQQITRLGFCVVFHLARHDLFGETDKFLLVSVVTLLQAVELLDDLASQVTDVLMSPGLDLVLAIKG